MTEKNLILKKRFLYLTPGPLPPNKDPKLSKFYYIDFLFGDILSPVWWDTTAGAREYFGENNFPIFRVNNFNYHFLFVEKYPKFLKPFLKILLFILKGIELRIKNGRYDYIMSYGTNSTGIACLILKLINRAKYISEIPGVPEDGSKFDLPPSNNYLIKFGQFFRQFMTDSVLRLVGSQADSFKLLYDTQLDCYPTLSKIHHSTFHDFVPTGAIESLPKVDEKYILTLGFPWYRKGVDVLIKAFLEIEKDFVDYQLYCVGWYLNKEYLIELSKDHSRIKIMKQVPAVECYKLMAECSVFVLPSRSEAMGRVLIEAMAAKKPIIASNTNGIPTYVKDGFNGILVEPGDHKGLASALSKILNNSQFAKELGDNGYKFMKDELSEDAYVRKFKMMIESINENQT